MANILLNPTNAESLDIEISGSSAWADVSAVISSNNLSATNDFDSGEGVGISDYLYINKFNIDLEEGSTIHGFEIVMERKGVGEINDYYVGLVYPEGEGITITEPGKQLIGNWPLTDSLVTYGAGDDTFNREWTVDEVNHDDFGFVLSVEGNAANLDAALIDHVSIILHYAGAMDIESTGGSSCGGSAAVGLNSTSEANGGILGGGSYKCIHEIIGEGGAIHGGTGEHCRQLCTIHHDYLVMATGDKSVPPNNTHKKALATFDLSGSTLHWNIRHDFYKLKTVQICGPAKHGEEAAPIVYAGKISGNQRNPMIGSAELTEEEIGYIDSGKAYFRMESSDSTQVIRAQIVNTSVHVGGKADLQIIYLPKRQKITFDIQEDENVQLSMLAIFDEEGSGGSVAGGISFQTYDEEGISGIVAGGTASTTFFDQVEGSGGSVAGGIADPDFVDQVEGSGGSVAGGNGEENFVYETEGISGAVAGGIGFQTYDEEGISGAVAGGIGFQTYDEEGINGTLAGGSSEESFVYDIEGISGSVAGGSGEENFVYNIEGIDGAVAGGEAKDTPYIEEGLGGSVAAGLSDPDFIDQVEGLSGGAVAGGIGYQTYNETASGGIEDSGEAGVSLFDQVESLSGGSVVAGIADIISNETRAPTGGIVAGGEAKDTPYVEEGLGGAVANGEGKDTPYIEEGSGGAVASGSAKTTPFVEEGSGGAVAGGAATGAFITEVPVGGIVASGISPFTEINVEEGSGGAEIGETAEFFVTFFPSISGGSVHGGVAFEDSVYNTKASGGAVLNSGGIFFVVFMTEEGDGGTVIGGIIPTHSIAPFHEGGAVIGGGIDGEQVIFNPGFDGSSAVVNGTAGTTFFDYEDGEGGIVATPKARIEFLRFFAEVKNKNVALALEGDNIVKTAFIEGLLGEQIIQRFPAFGVVPAPDPEKIDGIRFDPAAEWCDFDEPICPKNGAFLTDLTQSNQGEDNIPPKNRGLQPRDRSIARLS